MNSIKIQITLPEKQAKLTYLETTEFVERVDPIMLNKIINSEQLIAEWETDAMCYENERAQLIAYRKKLKVNGNIGVKYKMSNVAYGRVNPAKSLSLATIRRQVRHTLCKDTYTDVDIENCHPVILNQICAANNIEHKYLDKYVKKRDKIIKEVMETYKVDRSDDKTLFIQLMYFGTFDSWASIRK